MRFIIIITTIFYIALAYFTLSNKTNNKIICDSSFFLYKNGYEVHALISYSLINNQGVTMINGFVISPDKKRSYFDRKTAFIYKDNHGLFSFKSTNSYSITSDNDTKNDVLSYLLPVFYLKSDINYDITITKVNKSAWLFSTEQTPNFICSGRTL